MIRRVAVLLSAALVLAGSALVAVAATTPAHASGSNIPGSYPGDRPFWFTAEGVRTAYPIPAGGHLNTNAGSLHFDPNNGHPGAAFIGETLVPWSALGVAPGACITWGQFSSEGYHFGENNEGRGGVDERGWKFCVPEPPTEEPELPALPKIEVKAPTCEHLANRVRVKRLSDDVRLVYAGGTADEIRVRAEDVPAGWFDLEATLAGFGLPSPVYGVDIELEAVWYDRAAKVDRALGTVKVRFTDPALLDCSVTEEPPVDEPPTEGPEAPEPPVLDVRQPTCAEPWHKFSIVGHVEDVRFVAEDGTRIRAEDIAAAQQAGLTLEQALEAHGLPVVYGAHLFQVVWYDRAGTKADVALGSLTLTLTDPATLDCAPPVEEPDDSEELLETGADTLGLGLGGVALIALGLGLRLFRRRTVAEIIP